MKKLMMIAAMMVAAVSANAQLLRYPPNLCQHTLSYQRPLREHSRQFPRDSSHNSNREYDNVYQLTSLLNPWKQNYIFANFVTAKNCLDFF